MSLLSLRTGLRCTEIFKLKGADVDDNAGVLHVIAKGGDRKPVQVPEDMIAMLQAYDRKPGEPIFQAPLTGKAFTKTPAAFTVKRLGLAPEQEGLQEGIIEVARNALRKNMDYSMNADLIGLSLEEVKR
jgi:integrase